MTALDEFHPVTEVIVDDRSRVSVSKAGGTKGDRYAVLANDDGVILLTPVASIPKRELAVWENEELKASLFRGLADAAAGNARPLDWVTADDGDEE